MDKISIYLLRMEILSWDHWKSELKEFVDGFITSEGLQAQTVVDVAQKRHLPGKWDLSLMFVPFVGSPQISEDDLDQLCELLPKVSRDWRYQIESAERESKRIMLTMARLGVSIGAIQTVAMLPSDKRRRQPVTLHLDLNLPPGGPDVTLTAERQLIARDVTDRLLRWAGYDVTHSDGDCPPASDGAPLVCVTAHPRLPLSGERGDGDGSGVQTERGEEKRRAARLVVEPVVSAETGRKELELTAAELRRRRCAALLSAGRSRERGCSPERAARLAAASVAHQLLQVSVGSPCRVATGPVCGERPADGALFALYNGARLRALLAGFEERVAAGEYPPLPPVAQLGHKFSALSTEDEWELVWRHLLPFPGLVQACAEASLAGRPALHRLCSGLEALSHTFSRYYSRTHVLTPPLEHLMDTLHVRIHLLKAAQIVFDTYFELLGYEPLERM
ncbi:uncharacterized protein LOC122392514 isoform X1 [Amphibalanus amphitrite]|uniref:uncharacterized protein LOC122392514 isoform X1 n=1 Tax=Amphibalanus amphitrite TaxID=1232801 RepID=UPI001C903E84|nr:uncharacterized protein LOC122392514 isoform X1 [Amphibalanus amphitrite]